MERKAITGSTLKIIAIVTMLIDHIGAVIIQRMIVNAQVMGGGNSMMTAAYYAMRFIGRLAFPIFCFLLVEGFVHTRSRVNYAKRLLIFAIISEIPFDLATNGKLFDFSYQNVFFTLLIGLLVLHAFEVVKEKLGEAAEQRTLYGSYVVIACIGMLVAYLIKSDYSLYGVLAIVVMYACRESRIKSMLYACAILVLVDVTEAFAIVNTLLVGRYNGERGLKIKYAFYVFYPAHLLILYLIARAMGL